MSIFNEYSITKNIIDFVNESENALLSKFKETDNILLYNQLKVLLGHLES